MASKDTKAAPVQGGQGGRGSLVGGMHGDAVSTDKLWRARIAQELVFLQTWKEEMRARAASNAAAGATTTASPDRNLHGAAAATTVTDHLSPCSSNGSSGSGSSPQSSAALKAYLLAKTTPVGSAMTVDVNELSAEDLASLQKELMRGQYQSTQRTSYSSPADRAQLELPGSSHTHKKQKFHY